MRLAVIPARGGSKRIPRKNIREFLGKPMIAWQIDTARASGLFDRVIVSTEDEEIASIARHAGAEAPFVRPAELSDDHTTTAPVIAHAVRALANDGWTCSFACCIYPCAVFTTGEDLEAGFALLQQTGAAFCYPVVQFPHPPQRGMRRLKSGAMQFVQPEAELTRTQDLEPLYHDAGQFYWGRSEAWIGGMRIHSNAVGLELPAWRFVDIDTLDDWRRAEMLFSLRSSGRAGP